MCRANFTLHSCRHFTPCCKNDDPNSFIEYRGEKNCSSKHPCKSLDFFSTKSRGNCGSPRCKASEQERESEMRRRRAREDNRRLQNRENAAEMLRVANVRGSGTDLGWPGFDAFERPEFPRRRAEVPHNTWVAKDKCVKKKK